MPVMVLSRVKPRSVFRKPHARTMRFGSISSVTSPRSHFPPSTDSVSNASSAAATASPFNSSGSMQSVFGTPAAGPVQGPFLPDVEVARQNEQEKDEHLNECEKLQLPVDHRPRIQEYGFDIKEDEEHGDQVELHTEALARVARGGHAALVRKVLHLVAHAPAKQP